MILYISSRKSNEDLSIPQVFHTYPEAYAHLKRCVRAAKAQLELMGIKVDWATLKAKEAEICTPDNTYEWALSCHTVAPPGCRDVTGDLLAYLEARTNTKANREAYEHLCACKSAIQLLVSANGTCHLQGYIELMTGALRTTAAAYAKEQGWQLEALPKAKELWK